MLKVENLGFSYGSDFALQKFNIKVAPGAVLGIIGQSGSGKSTLLSLIAGFLDSDEGVMTFGDKKIKGPSEKLVAGNEGIKLVTQHNTLFPNISISENIAYAIRTFTPAYQQKRVSFLAKHFNIAHLLTKLPRELSGGEIQRVQLAKAIADEPKLLLLDEPFANLDITNKRAAALLLKRLIAKEAIVCIIVTHDIADAFGFADEIMIVKSGKMVQKGSPETIYFKPNSKYTAAITGYYFQIQVGEKSHLIRPEHIEVVEKGHFEGEVQESVFSGGFYLVWFLINDKRVFFKNNKSLSPGHTFTFNLNLD